MFKYVFKRPEIAADMVKYAVQHNFHAPGMYLRRQHFKIIV